MPSSPPPTTTTTTSTSTTSATSRAVVATTAQSIEEFQETNIHNKDEEIIENLQAILKRLDKIEKEMEKKSSNCSPEYT